jgi:3-hydroxymyristoyl/3-hydroxydecanoyl-(acyl carrier protein) dehydratase
MNEHFRAFSFVDRITSVQDGTRIQGHYVIPSELEDFPSSLAAEALGQLAAWAAMKASAFERRPVAGLAGRIDLLGTPRSGQMLELAVEVESLDAEAVVYRGLATINGTLVVRLEDCMGPMIPVADLDDPAALRERFAVLCGPGATPGAFGGLPPLALHRTIGEIGQCARATLQVPPTAALFADHFPRRPVFPGSLLMQVSLELAAALAAEMAPPTPRRWRPQTILDMKLREFIPPGKRLDLEARLKQRANDLATLVVGARADEEAVGGARVLLTPEEGS